MKPDTRSNRPRVRFGDNEPAPVAKASNKTRSKAKKQPKTSKSTKASEPRVQEPENQNSDIEAVPNIVNRVEGGGNSSAPGSTPSNPPTTYRINITA